MSWPLVNLGSIATIFNGKTPSRAEQRDDGYPVLKIRDVSEQGVFKGQYGSYVDCNLADKFEAKKIVEFDTLILNAAHNADYVGSKQYRAESEVVGALPTGEWLIVRSDSDGLDSKYLNFYLRSPETRFQIKLLVKGIHLYPKDVARLDIPLPPLPIQKQIATLLEKADTLRSQCKQMEQELNQLAQSVFLEMFGDPVTNPKGWKTRKLKMIVDDLQGGKSLTASEDEANSGRNRVLKISAVTRGEFLSSESKPLPNDYDPPDDHFVKEDDLLFSRANTTELVGATSLVFNTPDNVVLPDKLWRFVWKDSESLSQVFMWQLLSHPGIRSRLGKIATGSGGSMKNISKSKLYDFEVIFPDGKLQKLFEKKYLGVRKQLLNLDEAKQEYEEVFHSLMQNAFTGNLNLTKAA